MTDLNIYTVRPWQFNDHRGQIVSLGETAFMLADKKITWYHDMVSVSHQNVLRGIHVSLNLWKLATCVYGRIFLVVADCRDGVNFGKWQSWPIDDSDPIMVLGPPGFGLAHLVLSRQAVFYYKWSGPYDGPEQASYKYNDPRFGIEWPLLHELNCITKENKVIEPILSERDKLCAY